jgi:hypothetical protein
MNLRAPAAMDYRSGHRIRDCEARNNRAAQLAWSLCAIFPAIQDLPTGSPRDWRESTLERAHGDTRSIWSRRSSCGSPLTTSVIGSPVSSVASRICLACSILLDPDLEAAATPLNLEAKAAPIRRQLRIHTLPSRAGFPTKSPLKYRANDDHWHGGLSYQVQR